MLFEIRTRPGPYEILSALGAGGMGEEKVERRKKKEEKMLDAAPRCWKPVALTGLLCVLCFSTPLR